MTTEKDARTLFRTLKLPQLPEVAARVFLGIQSGKAGAKEVAELIETDPVFSARLLRMVNSAYVSLPVPVSSVRFAIAYLGLSEVSRISLALSVIATLAPERTPSLRAFWLHSYHTALVAKRVVRRVMPVCDAPEDLHAAALLHDIGRLVYERFFPEEHARIMAHARARQVTVSEAERELGLVGHGILGALLAEQWRLPKTVGLACRSHELSALEGVKDPRAVDPLSLTVLLSNAVCDLCAEPLSDEVKERIAAASQRVLGLDEAAFLVLMGDVYEDRDQAERAIEALL